VPRYAQEEQQAQRWLLHWEWRDALVGNNAPSRQQVEGTIRTVWEHEAL
jgi:hypothetical protein